MGPVFCSPHSIQQLLGELRLLVLDKSLAPRTLLCVNSHIYNLAWIDKRLRRVLNGARVTTADGMAIVWAARLFGCSFKERCNMTEAYHAFLEDKQMVATTAILIGCSEAEAMEAAERANRISSHCRIEQSYSGFLTDSAYEEIFTAHSEVDLILIGMGTPRTEYISEIAARICPKAVVWGVGGGTIRIDAGTMEEAPVVWRRMGLQWLFRLLKNPRTLWRRYLIGNPLFVARVARAAFARKFLHQKS